MIHVSELLSVMNQKCLITVRKINRLSKKMTIMSTVTVKCQVTSTFPLNQLKKALLTSLNKSKPV